MKKLVGWMLLILVVGCSRTGDKPEQRLGEVASQAGSTAVESSQSSAPAQAEPAPVQTAQPEPLAAQTAQSGEAPSSAPPPTSPIEKALAKKQVEDVSWDSRKTLKGIKQVTLVVWGFLDPKAVEAGLTPDLLFDVVKEKLEKAGIKVLKVDEANPDPGHAHIYVKLDIRKRQTQDVYIGHMDLSLFQFMYLGRNPKLVLLSECWSTHAPSFIYDQKTLVQYCREQLQAEVDTFIKDYFLFNPAPKGYETGAAKPKTPAGAKTGPSAKPSPTEKKQPAPEPPAAVPKPAPGSTVKPAGKKP